MRHLLYPPAVAVPITAHCQPTARLYHRRYLPQKPYRRILPPQAAVRLRIPRQTLLIKQAPTSKTAHRLTVQTNKTVHRLTAQTSKTTRPMLLLKRQNLRQTSRKAVLLPLHQASLQTTQALQQASLQTTQALQQASLRLQLSPIPPKSPPQRLQQKSLPQQLQQP